jgi:hypothetical protein
MTMFKLDAEHLFAYTATLRAPPEVFGPTPEGVRANFHVTGGEMHGPKLRGTVRDVGADFCLIRRDGVLELNVQLSLETHDGALIAATYTGYGDLGADGYEQFLAGKLPQRLALRTVPVLRTAHPDYQWLHRKLLVGVGEADLERFSVSYDVYAIG